MKSPVSDRVFREHVAVSTLCASRALACDATQSRWWCCETCPVDTGADARQPRVPRSAVNVQRWKARVVSAHGRAGTRTLELNAWADNDLARAVVDFACGPHRGMDPTDPDLFLYVTEEFGVVTFRGDVVSRGVVRLVTFVHAGRERVVVEAVALR